MIFLFLAGYSHPYVISFSERAIDVFNSSFAEWLQTIPLKKVCVSDSVDTFWPSLRLVTRRSIYFM